ncbi:MAG: hypothetical protein D3917_11310, partial [Candidatus Electrothrix sp. AX5]|nr:hypothetical protein [Candidatus Electrothrix sp. AX5]
VCLVGWEVRYRLLYLAFDSLWWSALKLLAGAKKNNTIVRVLNLTIQSCIGEDVLKKVAMKNTGEVNEEFLAFLGIKSSQLMDESFRI